MSIGQISFSTFFLLSAWKFAHALQRVLFITGVQGSESLGNHVVVIVDGNVDQKTDDGAGDVGSNGILISQTPLVIIIYLSRLRRSIRIVSVFGIIHSWLG